MSSPSASVAAQHEVEIQFRMLLMLGMRSFAELAKDGCPPELFLILPYQ